MFKQILFEWLFDFATKIFHTMQRVGSQAISQHWCMYIKSLYSNKSDCFLFYFIRRFESGCWHFSDFCDWTWFCNGFEHDAAETLMIAADYCHVYYYT